MKKAKSDLKSSVEEAKEAFDAATKVEEFIFKKLNVKKRGFEVKFRWETKFKQTK